MSAPAIQSVLQQMQTLSSDAAGGLGRERQPGTVVGNGGFAAELHASIERINQLQHVARSQMQLFESGSLDISLNDVMVDMQKAGLAFELGVQVRNRLLGAYREIMNMQV